MCTYIVVQLIKSTPFSMELVKIHSAQLCYVTVILDKDIPYKKKLTLLVLMSYMD